MRVDTIMCFPSIHESHGLNFRAIKEVKNGKSKI